MRPQKEHLGGGVYAELDKYSIVLTVESGIDEPQRIVLDPVAIGALLSYIKAYLEAIKKEATH